MTWRHATLVLALAGSAVAAAPSSAQEAPTETVLITASSASALDRVLADGGTLQTADAASTEIASRVAVAELTPEEIAVVAAAPGIVAVEHDAPVFAAEVPNDPCYADPGAHPPDCQPLGTWHVDRVGLPAAWDLSHGSQGAVVAVIDSGVAVVPELQGKLLAEIDVTGTPACTDGADMHHGTAVASVIGASTNDGIGIPGVGWDTPVLPVRIFPGPVCDGTSLQHLLAGMTQARSAGARILNLSLTASVHSPALQAAVVDAVNAGVVVVGAAGNANSTSPAVYPGGYPAVYPEVLSVGATGTTDARSSFSNHGYWVDVFAPGEDIQTYDRSATPVSADGTSFAAPIVSGVVSLLRSVRPSLTPAQISAILVRSADPVNGLLRLDARGALHDAVFGSAPAVGAGVHAASGTLDVIARANNNQPWARTVGAANTRWTVLDGLIAGDADLVSSAAGTLDVVARGIDGRAYRRSRTGDTWGPWIGLGGQFTSDLTVASWGGGRLDVIGRGLDGALWHNTIQGGVAAGWQSLGGGLTSEPDLASWGAGRLDVFARGLDGAMWHRAMTPAGWQPWEWLGGSFRSGPGAISVSAGTVHVAAVGGDSQMWMLHWDGSRWVGWYPLGGLLVSSPDLATRGPGTVEVYARASDQQLWGTAFTGGGFTGWMPVS